MNKLQRLWLNGNKLTKIEVRHLSSQLQLIIVVIILSIVKFVFMVYCHFHQSPAQPPIAVLSPSLFLSPSLSQFYTFVPLLRGAALVVNADLLTDPVSGLIFHHHYHLASKKVYYKPAYCIMLPGVYCDVIKLAILGL